MVSVNQKTIAKLYNYMSIMEDCKCHLHLTLVTIHMFATVSSVFNSIFYLYCLLCFTDLFVLPIFNIKNISVGGEFGSL